MDELPKRPMMSSTAEVGVGRAEDEEARVGLEGEDPDPKMSARRSFVDWAEAVGAGVEEGDSEGSSSPMRSRRAD